MAIYLSLFLDYLLGDPKFLPHPVVLVGYVVSALQSGNLPRARKMLSYVVGRDTENLNAQQIIKATLETIAENTIDGVLAPLFYMCLGYFWLGLPGAVVLAWLYKAVNTMDSMVGYKNERYREFGTCAARLDDVANLPHFSA